MENLRFTIAAGETKTFERGGRYLEIIEANSAVTINLYDAAGGRADGATKILAGTYMESPYSKFEVFSATAQTVELFLTDTRGGTRRQPGIVQVVDSRAARTKTGFAYGWRFTGFGAAAQFPTVTLQNPNGSGKNLVITRIVISSNTAGAINIGSAAASVIGAANATPVNKLLGGAASIAVVNATSNPVAGAGVFSNTIASVLSGANQAIQIQFDEPVVMQPGTFFAISSEAANSTITGSLEYYEETR